MVEIDIPQSLFEEEGRQMYGAKLMQVQVSSTNYILQDHNLLSWETIVREGY